MEGKGEKEGTKAGKTKQSVTGSNEFSAKMSKHTPVAEFFSQKVRHAAICPRQ